MWFQVLLNLWANLTEVRWSPDNTCSLCVKFWAVTLKLLQEVGGFFISEFLMDLHQQKWRGKIYVLYYWNQSYKVKHCHLLAVLYSKLPWSGRARCPVCAKNVVLGKPWLAFSKSAFYDPKHFTTLELKAVQLRISKYLCFLYSIKQTFMLKAQRLWEYFIKILVL